MLVNVSHIWHAEDYWAVITTSYFLWCIRLQARFINTVLKQPVRHCARFSSDSGVIQIIYLLTYLIIFINIIVIGGCRRAVHSGGDGRDAISCTESRDWTDCLQGLCASDDSGRKQLGQDRTEQNSVVLFIRHFFSAVRVCLRLQNILLTR